jgi:uracil-DNA glycosylase
METWKTELSFFDSKPYHELKEFLNNQRQEKSILPRKRNVFNALKLTRFEEVKVVILGQDPYPNPEHAHGLAFSIPKTTEKIPKSLKNILKELKADVGVDAENGNLEPWAKQGVLLLNTVLTVEEGNSNSHQRKGWETLTTEIIQSLSEERDHIVFILWGRKAQKFKKFINPNQHKIIESPHPSPLSAYRGFWGSKPFSKTNKYLKAHGKEPIDWTL